MFFKLNDFSNLYVFGSSKWFSYGIYIVFVLKIIVKVMCKLNWEYVFLLVSFFYKRNM